MKQEKNRQWHKLFLCIRSRSRLQQLPLFPLSKIKARRIYQDLIKLRLNLNHHIEKKKERFNGIFFPRGEQRTC